MPNPEIIVRNYDIPDLEMLQKAQSFHNNFVIDSVALIAALPSLAAPFITNFQTQIDDADAIPDNEDESDLISIQVSAINNKAEVIRNAIQECYVYVKVAFNDDQAYNKAFGKGKEYADATGNHIKTKELLEKVHRNCEKTMFKSSLITAGFTQVKIDNLETLMNDFDALVEELEDMKTDRLIKTRDRIIAYNTVWASMVRISDAAKIAFADNATKLAIYTLYPTPSNNPHKVQGLAYNAGLNKLTWDVAENADMYVVEAMQQFPLSEPTYTMRTETPLTEWIVALPPATYSFRIKGKNGGVSGPYSDSLDNVVIAS